LDIVLRREEGRSVCVSPVGRRCNEGPSQHSGIDQVLQVDVPVDAKDLKNHRFPLGQTNARYREVDLVDAVIINISSR